jgi:hypothetical protein
LSLGRAALSFVHCTFGPALYRRKTKGVDNA